MRPAFVSSSCSARRLLPCALLAAVALLASCRAWQSDRVEVSLAAAPGPSGQALHRVSLIVGGERVAWPVVAAGDEVSATFVPEPGADRQVTLLFNQGSPEGARLSWEGPTEPASPAGYRLRIAVDGAGVVHHQRCTLPCRLP